MKKLIDIFQETEPDKVIRSLQNKPFKVPAWSDLEKEYEPRMHKIFDKVLYPDKQIYESRIDPETNKAVEVAAGEEPITRVALGLQKLAVKRIVEFMYTTPPDISCEDLGAVPVRKEQFDSFKKILKKTKWNSMNKERCHIVESQCECAVYWYSKTSPTKTYGFNSASKLKYQVFSPEKGDELYPYFDDSGDMVAFSRMFSTYDEKDLEIKHFETWTDENYMSWKLETGSSGWIEDEVSKPHGLDRIPIVYTHRKQPIWADADNDKVHNLEKILSRNGDIIDYHSDPILLLSGDLQGAPAKGDSNRVFIASGDAKAQYVSWDQSIESTKFSYDYILRMYFHELQLPDLSFENIKGIGALSGVALEFMFADAHLKVGDESEIFLNSMERDYSIIKAYMALMNTKWADSIQDMEIETEINPFIISDALAKVDLLLKANGQKAIVPQELSVQLSGLAKDPANAWKMIQAEQKAEIDREANIPLSGEE